MTETSLRPLFPDDCKTIAELANNRNIWDNVRDHFPHPYTEKNAGEFIELQRKNDKEKVFAIEFNSEFCGMVGLILQKDVYRKSAEIGYWVGEPFWGLGVGTKAVELIVQYAFENLNLVRIFAGVFEYNIGSMKVLEKNGFQKEGVSKKAVFKNGKFWDEHKYALLAQNSSGIKPIK